MKYSSRGLRRRGDTDKWEVTLSHKDPLSGEFVRSFHTVKARTEKQAQKRKNELIRELDDRGLSAGTKMTISELADLFIEYKADSGTIERSTLDGYRKQIKALKRDLGDIRVCELTIPDVNTWMASMTERGYAPRSVQRPFAVLEAMRKDAAYVAAELGAKFGDPYILGTQEGDRSRPYHPTALSKEFRSFCKINAFDYGRL